MGSRNEAGDGLAMSGMNRQRGAAAAGLRTAPLLQRSPPVRIVTTDGNHPEAPPMIRTRTTVLLAALSLAAGVIVFFGLGAARTRPPAVPV